MSSTCPIVTPIDVAPRAGLLIKVTDNFSKSLNFTYNAQGKIATQTDPNGNITRYNYEGYKLSSVTYPDDTPNDLTNNPKKTFLYGELDYLPVPANGNFPNSLTGIIDENGERYATYQYDTTGRAISTEHAVGINKYSLAFNADGSTSVTDPLGTVRTTHFTRILDVLKNTGSDQPAGSGCSASSSATTYDENGNVASKTDFNGNTTHYTFDLQRNLETSWIEAVGTPNQKTTLTQWHTEFRLPIQIDSFDNANNPLRTNTFSYDDFGRLLTRIETDSASGLSRTNNYTYDAATSQIKTIDGPRVDANDITTFDYDTATGNLLNITNALGHTTQITEHDASGRPIRIVDANLSVTTLSYHPRGWLTSRSLDGQTTTFEYDNVGQLIKLTRPKGTFTQYTYDAAHRLTDITDNLGNTLHYTLDKMGNVLKEEVKDGSGQLARIMEQEYDQLSRLLLNISGENQTRHYQYDANGNLTTETDARNTPSDRNAAKTSNPLTQDNTVTSTYDALNRLIVGVHRQQSTDTSDDISSHYQYNTLDQLVKVSDANGAGTHYTYNALGDLLEINSPDTGITTYTYDEAGNRIRQTDAKNITVNYAYDALNRLTSILYPDSSLNIHYTFDENNNGQNGIGRLTSMTDGSGTTAYSYDKRGNLTIVSVIPGGVTFNTHYAYNGADQLTQITYPSGRTVDYGYDAAGRIDDISTTDSQGSTKNLLTNIKYEPFGPINGMVYGNGLPSQLSFDLDYRPTELNANPALDRSYSYDEADNITGIINNLIIGQDQNYAYDGLSRLIDAQSFNGNLLYQYDSNGNRTQLTDDGMTDNYQYPLGSNRLQDINNTQLYSYDANGNTTHLPNPAIFTDLVYGDHNRLSEVNGVKYTYNGIGQRVIKDNGNQTHYHYGLSGQLIAESDTQGNTLKEYLYLEDRLIALVEKSTGSAGNTEIVLDNPDASFSDNWPSSTGVSGYQGSNYQFHAGSSVGPGVVGSPIDNQLASFTGTWPNSTSVKQYYQGNYQYHAGSSAGLGVLGHPVDNQQASFTGTWSNSTSVKQFYAGNYQYHAPGTGSNTATWSTGVSSAGSYDVYISWAAHANRASNAKFTLHHANGSDTVTVDQQQNGGQWNLLGIYPLDSSSTISLSDDADGYVIADAITVLPAGTVPTVTQSDDKATWALDVTTPGRYDVYTTWAAHSNRATNAQYTIQHAAGSDTITVNQQQNGGQWNMLGTFDLDANSNVELSSVANGYVVADAVSILPEGTTPETTSQGEIATWTPNQTGEFHIYANWTAHANRATDAQYTIDHVSGNNTINVNQKQNGGQWHLLGTFTLDTGSKITLSSVANGYVIADGIRLVNITPTQATQGVYFVHNDHLSTPQVITDENQAIVWQADYDPFGKATVTTGTISNNIRFPGQYFDSETGLHYNYQRYYDPFTGRYITSDPIGLQGGLNTYGYVGGNPLRWIDPLGLVSVAACANPANAAQCAAAGIVPGGRASGAANTAGMSLWCLITGTCSANEALDPEQNGCPIPGATPGETTKGRSKNFDKPGGFDQANDDFDNLNPDDVREITDSKGGKGRAGILPDGRKINVRPNSTDGRPTIEIKKGKNKIKI